MKEHMSKHQYWITAKDRAAITAMPCMQCGHEGDADNPIEVDHIIARANGGRDHISNYQPLCRRHNQAKSDREPAQAPYFSSRVFTEDAMFKVMSQN